MLIVINAINFQILLTIATLGSCGFEHEIKHHEGAHSYQNVYMEHFHSVPTYVKKEDKHLLEHPISLGQSSSKLEVHHGGKHDHGYAIASVENDIHGHSAGFNIGGLEDHEGFEGVQSKQL